MNSLDALAAELTRRYRTGAASVDALLVGEVSRPTAADPTESATAEEG